MKVTLRICWSPSRLALFTMSPTGNGLIRSRRSFTTLGMKQDTYGFIGLGRMGYPMAKNLRAKIPIGDTLIIYDRNTQATSTFLQEAGSATEGKGGTVEIARDPREVAEKSTTILTALPEPSHVRSVFDAILASPLPSLSSTATHNARLFIDTSTIDPTTSRSIASAVSSTQSGEFIDAPMSGGVVGAQAGTLSFMVGCPPASNAPFPITASSPTPQTSTQSATSTLDRLVPVMLHMGGRIFPMGPQSTGLSAKLCNNYLLAITNIATCEAFHLGSRLGLPAKALAALVNSSSGRCWSSEVNNPVPGVVEGAPAGKGYEGGFGTALMRKDLRLAVESAREAGARLEMGDRAGQVYDEVERSIKGKDFSVVYKWLEEGDKS